MTRQLLERYRDGEREPIWQELVALGPRVREPAYLPDARAVAHETMQRARHNLDTIVERLRARGYAFRYPDGVRRLPNAELVSRLDRLEAHGGLLPIALRVFYDVVGEVCLIGSLPGLSGESPSPDFANLVASTGAALSVPIMPVTESDVPPAVGKLLESMPPEKRQLIMQARATARELTRRFDQPGPERHALALTLFEQMKARSASRADVIVADPIVVQAPHSGNLEDYWRPDQDEDPEEAADSRYFLDISPDAAHKANMSGGGPYSVAFPDPVADAPIVGLDMTLVEYLRVAFRWGGFPGLAVARPETAIDWLTTGLLEI